MDDEPSHYQRRIFTWEIIESIPAPEPPSWAPPIALREAAELDKIVVRLCETGIREDGWCMDWSEFYEVIIFIWSKRLPLQSQEVWAILRAHGVPSEFELELSDFFHKGRDLLVQAIGKKPVKKRRVLPLSTLHKNYRLTRLTSP